ncbi:hypothetical protein [Alloprevotella tannerae]
MPANNGLTPANDSMLPANDSLVPANETAEEGRNGKLSLLTFKTVFYLWDY